MPATRPADDLYIAVGAKDDDDHVPFNESPAGDWLILVETDLDLGSATHFTAWKKGGPQPASYFFTSSGGGSERTKTAILRYSGQASIGAQSNVNFGFGPTATALGMTATSDKSKILRIYVCDTRGFTGNASAGIQRAKSSGAGGGHANYIVFEESSPGIGVSTGAHTANLDSSDDWSAYTLEIR